MSYYSNIPNLDMNGSNGESYNDHLRVENRERSGHRTRALHVKTHPHCYIAEMLKRQTIQEDRGNNRYRKTYVCNIFYCSRGRRQANKPYIQHSI